MTQHRQCRPAVRDHPAGAHVIPSRPRPEPEAEAEGCAGYRWTTYPGRLPQVQPPQRQGFGSILIRRSLGKILSSEVVHEFRSEGVFAEISLPLEDLPT